LVGFINIKEVVTKAFQLKGIENGKNRK